MGLFDTIKKDVTGGGDGDIDLQISAPETVHPNDASIPVTAQITNRSQAPQTITQVYSEYAETTNISAGFNPDKSLNRGGGIQEHYRNDTAFTLNAGETKTLNITLPFNAAKLLEQVLPMDNPAMQSVLGAISKVESIAETTSIGIRKYQVRVDLRISGKKFGVTRKTMVTLDRHNDNAQPSAAPAGPPTSTPPINPLPPNPTTTQPIMPPPPPPSSDPNAPLNPQ